MQKNINWNLWKLQSSGNKENSQTEITILICSQDKDRSWVGLASAGGESRYLSIREWRVILTGAKHWCSGGVRWRFSRCEDLIYKVKAFGRGEQENHWIKAVSYPINLKELCRVNWAGEKLEKKSPLGGLIDPMLTAFCGCWQKWQSLCAFICFLQGQLIDTHTTLTEAVSVQSS